MNLTKREKMAVLATFIYMLIMSTGMYVLKHVYHIDYGQPQMVTVLNYFLPFAVGSSLIIYFLFFRGTAFKKPQFNWWLAELFVASVLLAAFQFGFGDYSGKDMALIWAIIGSTFMVGIGEEMLFRGIIFTAFREKRGIYIGVLMSAFIFGFLHCTNLFAGATLGHTLLQMVSASLSGIVFAWVFYKTQNIIPAMICHWFWDMCLLIGLYVPISQAQYMGLAQNLFETVAGIVLLIIIVRHIRTKHVNFS